MTRGRVGASFKPAPLPVLSRYTGQASERQRVGGQRSGRHGHCFAMIDLRPRGEVTGELVTADQLLAGFVTAVRVVLTALKNAVERIAARTPGSGGELSHHLLKMFADTAPVPVFGKDGE